MKSVFFKTLSIKTRVTLFTLGIFLLSQWLLAFYAGRILRTDMQRMLSDQQFSTATFVASDVNDELAIRFTELESVAAGISAATMGNAATLQTMLEVARSLLRCSTRASAWLHRTVPRWPTLHAQTGASESIT